MALDAFPDEALLLVSVIEPTADYTDAGGYSVSHYRRRVDDAESMLAAVVDDLPGSRSATTTVRYGRPVHELLDVAESEDVDHIVIGSHGRDGAKRLLLGSVAETVARRSPVPVTVVRDQPAVEGAPERVLVPFDDSEPARAALSFAVEQYPDAEMTALYAVYPPSEVTGAGEAALGDIEDWADRLDEHTDEVLARAAGEVDREIQTETVSGNPAEAIVEYAADHADHIVMGSHGRDGLSRLIMGSVAETVVRRSPTSVTVVRERED
jgi:nucleotide-binding universal stress UspA family protein